MSIVVEYSMTYPSAVHTTLKITMTLGEWERVREALKNGSNASAWSLANRITAMMEKADKDYTETCELTE